MKAYQLTPGGGVDGIAAVELPDPRPGTREVLVRVRSTSLNYRDLMLARRATRAVIPLSDGAGDVVSVGAEVTELAAGDRIAGCFFPYWHDGDVTPGHLRDALGGARDGMLAELVVLPADSVVKLPSYMSHDDAAALPCAGVTAWNAMFEQAQLRPGQSVLFLGTGGVSILGLQLAQLGGLRSIITSSSDEKLERARALGADATINYRQREDWEQAVLELTQGRGVDLVLEVGGEATFAQSLASTRVGGDVVLIGGLGGAAGEGTSTPLVGRNIRATRISVGSRRMFEALNRALELREVHPVVDRTFQFEDAVDAYRYLESQAHFGKVSIRVSDE
jgi:NADPH:quinone reductase-like Zn-dependent oxidoreductase